MSEQLDALRSAVSILAMSMDSRTTLESLAKLAVSRFAEWCGVFIIENGTEVRRIAWAQTEASNGSEPAEAEVVLAHDDRLEECIFETFGPVSARFLVPVCSGHRKVGFMAFATVTPERRFSDSDAAMGRDLATAAAAAMENARLYNEIQ